MANPKHLTPGCLLSRKAMWIIVVLLMIPVLMPAQTQQDKTEGKIAGDYVVQQSAEVGYRFTDIHGNTSVYDTFVNLQDGPRILDYTLSMRSMSHAGSLFDTLYMTNAGYGGDPNNYSRMRMSKNRWYDFSGNFRRDVNYFDFNTLANPFNTANAYVSNAVSPHAMNTRRNMGDFNLVVAPQSPVRLRLGYSRNVNEGPSFVSYHEGTDIRLDQDFRARGDRYQIGADWKLAPKTQVSYDFSLENNKVDTSWVDNNLGTFQTPSGLPVDLGIIYDPALLRQPCGTNVISPAPVVSPGNIVKPDCNLYSAYSRFGPSRAQFATHQVSFSSSYFNNLEITASGTYSSGKNEMRNFLETGNAYISRTNEVGFQFTGPAKVGRVSDSAELGLTYHFNEQWSMSNQVRWLYWRLPGAWDSFETACFASLPVAPSSANPNNAVPPYAGIGTAPGAGPGTSCAGLAYAAGGVLSVRTGSVASPVADTLSELYLRYKGEESLSNVTLFEFEPSHRLALHAGFRFENRNVKQQEATSSVASNVAYQLWLTSPAPGHYVTVPATTVTTTEELELAGNNEQTQKSLLLGFHATPVAGWRIAGDFEKRYVDNPFTRISPKNAVKLKLRSSYRLNRMVNFGATMNLLEASNDGEPAGFTGVAEVRHKDHTRVANVFAGVAPYEWLTVDLGYNYGDILARTGTCMPITSGIAVEGGALQPCVTGTAIYPVILRYSDITHTGYANVMVKPVKRVTLMFGYDLTSTSGSTNWYRADTLAPLRLAADKVLVGGVAGTFVDGPHPRVATGSNAYNYTRPMAAVAFDLARNIVLKGAYNYYDYNEKSPLTGATSVSGSTVSGVVPRDFHGNAGTISLRYAF